MHVTESEPHSLLTASNPDSPSTISAFRRSLIAATHAHPVVRKRLVGPDINFGREHLAALARETGGWIGWEATTLRTIAEELAFVPLSERGIRVANDIQIGSLVNRALDAVIARKETSAAFVALGSSLGFRQSLRDSLLELRTSAVSSRALRRAVTRASPAFDVPEVLDEYVRLLAQQRMADPAQLFEAALTSFDREAPFVLDGIVLLSPALMVRGLPGQLLERLLAHGARPLEADPVIGCVRPPRIVLEVADRHGARPASSETAADRSLSALSWLSSGAIDDARVDASAVQIDIFAAATPSDELREVCRRVIAEGLGWDQVEIVATNVDDYGIALDALCQQLGIGASMLHGVPLARTRLGRALERWLRWLEDGLPSDILREALEAGELCAPASEVTPTALARELRPLKIGWGRPRYEQAIVRLESASYFERMRPTEDESSEEFAARLESRRRGSAALTSLLRSLLAAAPEVPERGSERRIHGSSSAFARATLDWLSLVPVEGIAEQQTALRFRTRLEQIAALEEDDVSFSNALAAFRDALSDLRAWPLVTAERKPWSAAGGMLHLTDLAHAGSTGRPRMFFVGLDADRTVGGTRQDPLLPDAVRRSVGGDALVTSLERREEAGYALAAALASLRGRVSLSYATSISLASRESGPAPVLLQAWRKSRRAPRLSYDDLRNALRPPASAVPQRNVVHGGMPTIALLDARDVWLDAIADGPLLLDADALVIESFPMLGGGLLAADRAFGPELDAYHGLVPQAGPMLDPTAANSRAISPSEFETLSTCPLSWFYRYGLSLRLPEDAEYDATRWLDAAQRGSLLHEIFETFIEDFRDRQGEIRSTAVEEGLLAIANSVIAKWRAEIPPPGVAVYESESAELRSATRAFLAMELDLAGREQQGVWRYVEYELGRGKPDGEYELGDGRVLRVTGRVDRVDDLAEGALRVIDYKTGQAAKFTKSSKKGVFNGGRHLQPALYSAALEKLLGARVARFEYRFPTQRGHSEIIAYSAAELAPARAIIASLLDCVAAGTFIPTLDRHDCSYCDHQSICRVDKGQFDITSPRAEWAADHESLDVFVSMRTRRSSGDGE